MSDIQQSTRARSTDKTTLLLTLRGTCPANEQDHEANNKDKQFPHQIMSKSPYNSSPTTLDSHKLPKLCWVIQNYPPLSLPFFKLLNFSCHSAYCGCSANQSQGPE